MNIELTKEETEEILKQEFQRQYPTKDIAVYHQTNGIFNISVSDKV